MLRERRSGFDRRRSHFRPGPAAALEATLLYLRDHPAVLAAVLATANVLSLLDLILTTRLLELGAIEGNPIMASLFRGGAADAAVFKIGLVAVAGLILWSLRRHRAALVAAILAASAYLIVVVFELSLLLRLA